jgi:hypothetical protein
MVLNMKGNGLKLQILEMEEAYKYGQMDQDMKAIGEIIELVVEVD